ncbi:hypothetical protein C8F01DRAFT_1111700 [Mycena amicta]|nr:hypothetical protein C8F01DRAFT_1111700 [Mycena amicta]
MKKLRVKVGRVLRRLSGTPKADAALSFSESPPPVKQIRVITGDPKLPPELERKIFELAAVDDEPKGWSRQNASDTMLVLPLVCQRARAWIEPLIYKRISLLQTFNGVPTVPLFLETLDTRPASFFAQHVKVVYLNYTMTLPTVQRVLSVCTNAVSVGCHQSYSKIAHLLVKMPLQRLMVADIDFSAKYPPWTHTLTHLGISASIPHDEASLKALFSALPSVTAFTIGADALPDPMDGPGIGRVLQSVLTVAPQLKAVVLATDSKTQYRWSYQRLREEGFDSGGRLYVHLRPVSDGT